MEFRTKNIVRSDTTLAIWEVLTMYGQNSTEKLAVTTAGHFRGSVSSYL